MLFMTYLTYRVGIHLTRGLVSQEPLPASHRWLTNAPTTDYLPVPRSQDNASANVDSIR